MVYSTVPIFLAISWKISFPPNIIVDARTFQVWWQPFNPTTLIIGGGICIVLYSLVLLLYQCLIDVRNIP